MSISAAREPRKVYAERFVFMAALLVPATFHMGVRAPVIGAVSVILCMLTDKICCLIRRMPYDIKDIAVPFWGLCAAMLMPPSINFAALVLSSVVCVVIGKHFFGASDNILFSPPAIAAAFLIICYPSEMLFFPKAGEHYPIFGEFSGTLTRSMEYSLKLGNVPTSSTLDLMLGNFSGALGTVHILIILVCGVCMIIRRTNSALSVIPCAGVVCLLAFFFPRAGEDGLRSVLYELCSGYMLFGIVFMMGEPYLTPKRAAAKVIYGVVLGYMVMMFRYFGQTEGSFVFALLFTNALSSCFDTIIDNIMYWKKTYINSYESSRTQVQRGGVKLSDTQEIKLPAKYRYHTPPIDGEIKRHRKRNNNNPDTQNKEKDTPNQSTKKEGGDEREDKP